MKEFNITGLCLQNKHYMADMSESVGYAIALINKGKYFTINRARQYGKTTLIHHIYLALKKDYLVIEISFESLGNTEFSSEQFFIHSLISLISKKLKYNGVHEEIIAEWENNNKGLDGFLELSKKITELVNKINKDTILIIDEVDKITDNELFLNFLGMLRSKYLEREKGEDQTFLSVILAGVYDIKNLKLKMRPDEQRRYNSPWNIAVNFTVDMFFKPAETAVMLTDYENEHHTGMDVEGISEEIYDYTGGYPFLVSYLCKLIHEEGRQDWTKEGVKNAVNILLMESNTLFDDLIKNIENNEEFARMAGDILINGAEYSFVRTDPVINIGLMYGIFSENSQRKVKFHNRIFELLIYNHLTVRQERKRIDMKRYGAALFISPRGDLLMENILNKFQELMAEEYRKDRDAFIEKEGRLIFLAFIKPIINGEGFYYVETQTRDNLRMDIVITFNKKQYIIELKKWYGQSYQAKGHEQLFRYLDIKGESEGYLIMFDCRKCKKEFNKGWIEKKSKRIYEVTV